MENQYFYCYSPFLRKHIESKGIKAITESFNTNTNSRYKVYEQTDKLTKAIKEYKEKNKN